jgi:hypothetical protein
MDLVPNNHIALIAHANDFQNDETINMMFSSLKGDTTRDWFVKHAYYCLPLVIGNQYGFVLKSLYDVDVEWNGGERQSDVSVEYLDKEFYNQNSAIQSIKSHFGMGTITVQTTFSLRTPTGVNLMTINPPNYYIDGIYHMTGVIETDNLRRDFTYNLKITRPNYKIRIKKGDIVGCVIPYPRHFIDKYEIVNADKVLSQEQILAEVNCGKEFGIERSTKDVHKPSGNGRRYFRGEDACGNKFPDHQKRLDK